MRTLLLAFGLTVCAAMAASALYVDPDFSILYRSTLPEFRWSATTHDFGSIKRGVPVTHRFTFTNNGDEALVITSVKASCGCTVTSYSKDPVPTGGQGFVVATFNAASPGVFRKTVTVFSNSGSERVELSVKGVVVE